MKGVAILNQFPAADAAPVVHGKWVSLTECANAGVYCSVCNKKVWKEDYAWCNQKNKLRSNYCPHCGARMDGDKDAH
jgi:DNA-directed RNA polymerase subunit RPC12/RpoP